MLKKIYKYKASYLFVAPFALIFTAFTIIPVVTAIYYSFTYYNILQPPIFIWWQNYQKLFFQDQVFLISLKNTLIFATVTGPVSYFLSLLVAWFVNEVSPKFRSFLTLLFYAPALASGISLGLWQYAFSADQYGLINSILISLGFINTPIQWLISVNTMKTSVIIVVLWMSLGVSFLSFIAGFQNVDQTLYEAAAVDGIKNRYQELWYITLPSIKGQLMFGAVMSITASFGIGSIVSALCGFPSSGYAAHTIINHLQDYGGLRYEMGYACAIATVLFLIMVGTNKLVQKVLTKVGE